MIRGDYANELPWLTALLIVLGVFAALALAVFDTRRASHRRVRRGHRRVADRADGVGVRHARPREQPDLPRRRTRRRRGRRWLRRPRRPSREPCAPGACASAARDAAPRRGRRLAGHAARPVAFRAGRPAAWRAARSARRQRSRRRFPAPARGAFGADGSTRRARYVAAHGGGTIAVSSQSSAAQAIIEVRRDVAGIGGFSGRESDVSVAWLAQEVAAGKISWVLGEASANADRARRARRHAHGRSHGASRRSPARARRSPSPAPRDRRRAPCITAAEQPRSWRA